jgi:ABC-type nitrate/sulfonate/bicarbonate transport system permease component
MAGFSAIEEEFINLPPNGARVGDAWKIRIQSAMPNVFVGLKMAASSAMTGAVAEFWRLTGAGAFSKGASQLMALPATIATMGYWAGILYGMTWIESWAIRWHVSRRGGRQEIL